MLLEQSPELTAFSDIKYKVRCVPFSSLYYLDHFFHPFSSWCSKWSYMEKAFPLSLLAHLWCRPGWLNNSSSFSEAQKHPDPSNQPNKSHKRGCSNQKEICSKGSHALCILLIQEFWKAGLKFQTCFKTHGQTFCLSLAYFLVKYILSSLFQSFLMASKKWWLFILPTDGYEWFFHFNFSCWDWSSKLSKLHRQGAQLVSTSQWYHMKSFWKDNGPQMMRFSHPHTLHNPAVLLEYI